MVDYSGLTTPDLRIHRADLTARLAASRSAPSLFVFPAQSNFSGVKHPLAFVDEAHAAGWDVLLDAAAFVPTDRLDLTVTRPDFVTVSFYKMFGYTTGVGFFGHAVAESNDDLKALIAAAPAFPGPGFLLPTRNADVFRWCLARGLHVVQPMTLMSVGLYNEPRGPFLPSILY